jgi:hypothetical protein
MVKLVGLIPAFTAIQGLAEATGVGMARRVREAGFITSGPRGPGGAEMVDSDAANLLLGGTCSDEIKGAGVAVWRYRALFGRSLPTESPRPDCPEPMRWLGETAQGLTLGMALDRLIGMARTGELQTLFRDLAGKHVGAQGPERDAVIDKAINDLGVVFLRLEFRRPRSGATITFGEAGAGPRPGRGPYLVTDFGYQSEFETTEELDRLQTGDRMETVTVSHRTLFALGEALRQ